MRGKPDRHAAVAPSPLRPRCRHHAGGCLADGHFYLGRTATPPLAADSPARPCRPADSPADDGRDPIQVGALTLPPCPTSKLAWCTTIPVPLDYSDPAAPDLSAVLRVVPGDRQRDRRHDPRDPGRPRLSDHRRSRATTAARSATCCTTRNLLMVDLRGTGQSSLIKCAAVQHWSADTGTEQSYINAVGKCGDQLDHTWQRPDGSYVAASDLFTTANAARDVDRLLGQLHTGKVDFYGDSYGTFFGQTLTARFGKDLRSVTLDAAYPVLDENPFYPDAVQAAQTAFNVVLPTQRRLQRRRARPVVEPHRSAGDPPAQPVPVTGTTTTPDGDTGDADGRRQRAHRAGQHRRLRQRRLPRPRPGDPGAPRPTATRSRCSGSPRRRSTTPTRAPTPTSRPASTPRRAAATTRSRSRTPSRSASVSADYATAVAALPTGHVRAVHGRRMGHRAGRGVRRLREVADTRTPGSADRHGATAGRSAPAGTRAVRGP